MNERKLNVRGGLTGLVHPTWSPDSRTIAFGAVTWGEEHPSSGDESGAIVSYWICHVWTWAMDTALPREVANIPYLDRSHGWVIDELEWSRDGARLGWSLTSPFEGGIDYPSFRYFVVDRDGRRLREMDFAGFSDSFAPRRRVYENESPDKRKLLVTREVRGLDELFVAEPGRRETLQVTHTEKIRDTTCRENWGSAPVTGAWSRDGTRILFIPMESAGDLPWGRLFVVNADGTGQTALSKESYVLGEFPRGWSPDGKRLVFQDGEDVCVTDFSSAPRRIAKGRTPDWQP